MCHDAVITIRNVIYLQGMVALIPKVGVERLCQNHRSRLDEEMIVTQ